MKFHSLVGDVDVCAKVLGGILDVKTTEPLTSRSIRRGPHSVDILSASTAQPCAAAVRAPTASHPARLHLQSRPDITMAHELVLDLQNERLARPIVLSDVIRPTPVVRIINPHSFHHEVIESLMVHVIRLFGDDQRLADCHFDIHTHDRDYSKYVADKYPQNVTIKGSVAPDYIIYVTMYPSSRRETASVSHPQRVRYVMHNFDPSTDASNNVYLTPVVASQTRGNVLLPTVLPRAPSTRKSSVPIFVVQGSFSRRNFKIVASILHVKLPFLIRIIGKGEITPLLASILKDARVQCKVSLPFDSYHAQFQNAHAILPCVSRTTHKPYYTTKLTSSVSYAVGYDLAIVCDRPLVDAYDLGPRAFYYESDTPSDVRDAFIRCHSTWYTKKSN